MVLGMNTKLDPSEGVLRNETGAVGNPADYAHLVKDAATADAAEHTMSVRQAFKIHKKAVFWSMALSAALIMEGETPFAPQVALIKNRSLTSYINFPLCCRLRRRHHRILLRSPLLPPSIRRDRSGRDPLHSRSMAERSLER
jgi:hypothetical protein